MTEETEPGKGKATDKEDTLEKLKRAAGELEVLRRKLYPQLRLIKK